MIKLDKYVFVEITKGCALVFFIFLSIAWLLQFTRLISLTNLIQIDIFTIMFLSIFLIPNIITIILPFAIMFGLIITFLKLYKDSELVSIYTLGVNMRSIKKPLLYFTIINLLILIILNFYISPNFYKDYKIKEHEIRNNINFEKIIISNFLEINKDTFIDFKRNKEKFSDFFIKFNENEENFIFAKEANIAQIDNKFKFKLKDGFKITILSDNKIEKLEFNDYNLLIENKLFNKYDNYDKNTFDLFEDIKNKDYINIFYKFTDSLIIILIIILFYTNNIKNYNFNTKNLLLYVIFSTFILILNQILKNTNFNVYSYSIIFIIFILLIFIYNLICKKYVQN
ncbi:MAG: hypothetical protein CMP16_04330 [Rickettsiales bacterium]|nr:hypothetical protein [Rickettsiales bacterium]